MAIQKHTIQEGAAAIYAETDNLNYFLSEALEPDTAAGVTNQQASVSAYTRRRYVGDINGASIPASTREYLVDPGRSNGSATPGKEMLLDDGVERRAFTYTGPWLQVHSFLTGALKPGLTKCYSASARYDITVSAA
jgi:hypothetical protein